MLEGAKNFHSFIVFWRWLWVSPWKTTIGGKIYWSRCVDREKKTLERKKLCVNRKKLFFGWCYCFCNDDYLKLMMLMMIVFVLTLYFFFVDAGLWVYLFVFYFLIINKIGFCCRQNLDLVLKLKIKHKNNMHGTTHNLVI